MRVVYVPFRFKFADIFTKGLPHVLLDEFRYNLSVRSSLASIEGVY